MSEGMPNEERLLTFRQVTEYLMVSETTLYRYMRDKMLKGYKMGGVWRFYRKDVRSFLRSSKSWSPRKKRKLMQKEGKQDGDAREVSPCIPSK